MKLDYLFEVLKKHSDIYMEMFWDNIEKNDAKMAYYYSGKAQEANDIISFLVANHDLLND